MTKIKHYVEQIEDEICGAKEYAECYLEYKVRNMTNWANKYKEMAQDELKHATYIHDRAIEEIEELKKVYTPPQEMLDEWEKSHAHYVEKVAWVKQMLTM